MFDSIPSQWYTQITMKCTKCGNEIPSESKFCLSCGQVVSARSERPAPPPPKSKTALWAMLAGLLVVILALVLAFFPRGSKVTQAPPIPNPQQTPVLHAPAPPNGPQPNVLQTDVEKPPLKSPEKTPPPPEVVAYLEHLKKVDETREALQSREVEVLLNMVPVAMKAQYEKAFNMDEPEGNASDMDSSAEISRAINQLNRDWQSLCQLFLSVQAPEPCANLAGEYYGALGEVIRQVTQVNQMLAKAQLGSLQVTKGKSGSIDDKLDAADRELGAVCSRYGIDKSFAIKSDRTGGTGLFTLPGM